MTCLDEPSVQRSRQEKDDNDIACAGYVRTGNRQDLTAGL